MKKPIATAVTIFLLLIAARHVLRLVLKVEVVVDGTTVPQWFSIFGTLVPAGLALLLKRESSR